MESNNNNDRASSHGLREDCTNFELRAIEEKRPNHDPKRMGGLGRSFSARYAPSSNLLDVAEMRQLRQCRPCPNCYCSVLTSLDQGKISNNKLLQPTQSVPISSNNACQLDQSQFEPQNFKTLRTRPDFSPIETELNGITHKDSLTHVTCASSNHIQEIDCRNLQTGNEQSNSARLNISWRKKCCNYCNSTQFKWLLAIILFILPIFSGLLFIGK